MVTPATMRTTPKVRRAVGARDAESLALAGSAGLFLLYVVHVGGDFMYARRLLPAVPFFLLALESRLVRWPRPVARADRRSAQPDAAWLPPARENPAFHGVVRCSARAVPG